MKGYKKLAQNVGIFFAANFGTKLLTFLLVRLYTDYLSTEEFGIIDLLNTTSGLAIPIITLCITEAVLRFSIDEVDGRNKILTNGLFVTALGNVAFVLTAPIFLSVDTFADNVAWLYLLTLTNSLYTVAAHFSRGIGKTKVFAASGVVHAVLQIGLNILFLVGFSWGIRGYLVASVLANAVSLLYVILAAKLHQYLMWKVDKRYLKVMLVYAIPLIPNSVFWWIMQSADRYIITWFLTTADNGLYSAANKIPTIISMVSAIFFQAWQLSAVEEAQSEQKAQFYGNVFGGLAMLLILATSAIMVVLQPLYRVLVNELYYSSWTCVPFLLCSMVYSCYSSFLGTNYVAMKKTTGVFLTTVLGAVLNIALNMLLIPVMGIEGAALATLAAFAATWVVRVFGTRKFVKIKYPLLKFWIPSVLLLAQATLLTFGVHLVAAQVGIFLVLLGIYTKDLLMYMKKIIRLVFKKGGKADRDPDSQ